MSVEEKCEEPMGSCGPGGGCEALAEDGSRGGDMRERIMWRDVLPRAARP